MSIITIYIHFISPNDVSTNTTHQIHHFIMIMLIYELNLFEMNSR